MFLRNLLLLCFCVIVSVGIGLYVYDTHPYLVWGLLFLCWLCFRLKMRADSLFRKRSVEPIAVASVVRKAGAASSHEPAA